MSDTSDIDFLPFWLTTSRNQRYEFSVVSLLCVSWLCYEEMSLQVLPTRSVPMPKPSHVKYT